MKNDMFRSAYLHSSIEIAMHTIFIIVAVEDQEVASSYVLQK